ncbi:putative F-box/kelch-repeat protein [Sesbania bispinosa]|nr:putative F-box/kelch-repeat protein [Sesbania bispinosa]
MSVSDQAPVSPTFLRLPLHSALWKKQERTTCLPRKSTYTSPHYTNSQLHRECYFLRVQL